MKMSESLLGWQLHMQAGNYSTLTIECYIPGMGRVIKFPNEPEAADVTVSDPESFLILLRDSGAASRISPDFFPSLFFCNLTKIPSDSPYKTAEDMVPSFSV